jgi:hypothetical protein
MRDNALQAAESAGNLPQIHLKMCVRTIALDNNNCQSSAFAYQCISIFNAQRGT